MKKILIIRMDPFIIPEDKRKDYKLEVEDFWINKTENEYHVHACYYTNSDVKSKSFPILEVY